MPVTKFRYVNTVQKLNFLRKIHIRMEIGMIDLYTDGHHIPYAARTKQALEKVSEHDIKFITISETERCKEWFSTEELVFLKDPESPRTRERETDFDEFAESVISELFSTKHHKSYDVLHFLFADDILGPLFRHARASGGPRIVGELNGVFFERKTPLRQEPAHRLFLTLLKSPVGDVIERAIPDHTEHEQLWRDFHLYRCIKENVFDQIITHSIEANKYVNDLNKEGRQQITRIPYPAPLDFGTDLTKIEARNELDLPSEAPILLFFGTLRADKGINRLLRTLQHYEGPEFIMYIAGPPIDVTREQVQSIQAASEVNIITELGYVDTPEVYFRAADAIVLPYAREFGKECTSQTLEEASSSLLPVIVPDFGAVGRVTKEWNLGMTYRKQSDDALEGALAEFARDGVSYSEKKMQEYNRLHSYEEAATRLYNVYKE